MAELVTISATIAHWEALLHLLARHPYDQKFVQELEATITSTVAQMVHQSQEKEPIR